MSKAEFARALNIEQSGVTSLEAKDSWPKTRNLDRVLSILGATVHDLAWALDQVNQRLAPTSGSEVRDGSPPDPLDQLYQAHNESMRALVEEFKKRSPPR